MLRQDAYDAASGGFRSAPRDPDPAMQPAIDESYRNARDAMGKEDADKVSDWLDEAKKITKATTGGDLLNSVVDYRNTDIAHVLSKSFYNRRSPMRKAKYGDEKKLFDVTIDVVDKLHMAVNGKGFDWDGAKDQGKRNAEGFWHGVTINALE